jgi:HD-like signal output (HDOD) protein
MERELSKILQNRVRSRRIILNFAEVSVMALNCVTFPEARIGGTARPDGSAATLAIPPKLYRLPPMNATANRVLRLLSNAEVELFELAHIMELDPAFAGDVLFLANSSLFGFPSRVLSLRHAIALLGLERIKALAMTAAMRSFLGKPGRVLRQCWRHSAACAIIAEEISPIFHTPGDIAYSLGLLHDVGRLALLKAYPQESSNVLHKHFNNAAEAIDAERLAMTVDHCAVGGWLTKTWGLPEDFAMVCAHHHEAVSPNDPGLLQVAKTACCLADALGYPALNYTQPAEQEHATPYICRRPIANEDELKFSVETRLLSFD